MIATPLSDLTCRVCFWVCTTDNIKDGYCCRHTSDQEWLRLRGEMEDRHWPMSWAKTWTGELPPIEVLNAPPA